MALTICSGKLKHHKNPSGLHNKVTWLLVESNYNSNHLYALRLIVLVHNESWEKAFWIAEMICKKHFERIKERYPEDWYWARNYVNKERKRNELHRMSSI